MPPSHRSILPTVPGAPAGAAVLTAVTCTFIGFLIDTMGGDELTGTFASLYVIGCVLAALMVRYRGLFTTMVLPPLLLFLAVPLAYQQMLGNSSSFKVKEILLNLAIPLVNRFPTMALATVLVLIIGAVRVAMYRREQSGESGSPLGKPRARVARPVGAARAQRAGATDTKEPARRRFRPNPAEQDGSDAPESTPGTRRPAGRVAARPPRVGADRPAASGQTGNRQAGNRQAGTERKRTPPGDRKPNPDRKPTGERKPPAERRANPAERANPAAAAEPRRRRTPNAEVPPHPRPNVRYRERDSGRIEH
ncbi:hypothetical protein GFY24_03860 [Nocardia sp. SYP-A9097]|nr:hypothetical protein [Nocardia sp. SYP-A9097]